MFWRTFVDERSPVDVADEMGATPAARPSPASCTASKP
jgi:hypothetical protein